MTASHRSPVLALPLIQPAQAQKHVTHNEALLRLEAAVQLSVVSAQRADPPAAPASGARYIVGSGATGAWAGEDRSVATYSDAGWAFVPPAEGWRAWDIQTGTLLVFSAGIWGAFAGGGGAPLSTLGINATATPTNRLAVASAAALFTHDGSDHRLVVNKAGPAATGSLVYQSGWSGRVEIGLAGSDALSVKVSADGSAWTEALRLDPGTGQASGAAVQGNPWDTSAGRLMAVGAFGLGGGDNIISDLTVSLAPGHYGFLESAAAGSPGTLSFYCTLEVRRCGGNGAMTFRAARASANPSNMKMWHGARTGSTGPIVWTEMPLNTSLVGPVSQSGGVPTGAVIERGSGAGGRFTRLADGTLDCWTTLTGSTGAGSVWTYPAAFSTAPVVSGTAEATVLSAVCLDGAPGPASATLSARGANGSRRADVMHLRATGRWF